MRIYVSGSLAYDRIMNFPGKFSDHILPDKLHILNVSFMVDGMTEKFGGTAGNIAYNLALLKETPILLSAAGRDFTSYANRLQKMGLTLEGIRMVDEEFTACAYITTDQSSNQITGFNPGAMRLPSKIHIDRGNIGGSLAVVAPGNVLDMLEYPRTYRELNIPYIFDPGQQITALTGDQLLEALTGAQTLVSNDYELEMILKATGLSEERILERTKAVITTLGEKGARIRYNGQTLCVPAAKVAAVMDPTGAGDAFRAGLIKGMVMGLSLERSAMMGATCAAYCVEKHGTQEHAFTLEEFQARLKANFGE